MSVIEREPSKNGSFLYICGKEKICQIRKICERKTKKQRYIEKKANREMAPFTSFKYTYLTM